MADDLLQQAAAQAPMVAGGGVAGGGALIAALKLFKVFASPQDVELAEARMDAKISAIKAEFAGTYVTQEMLRHIDEKLDNISNRIDQLIINK